MRGDLRQVRARNRAIFARWNHLLVIFISAMFVEMVLISIALPSSDLPDDHYLAPLKHDIYLAEKVLKDSDKGDTASSTTITIAYVVSISGCGSDSLSDGAAVLKHSIDTVTKQSNNSSSSSKYDYQMYAIVHPDAESCGRELANLGYTIVIRDIPVPLNEIQGDILRTRIANNGCCGEKELIKLEALTLTDHPLVVHLDIDTIMLKPLDNLFDFMLGKSTSTNHSNVGIMWKDKPIPEYIEATFTRDYNIANAGRHFKPIQGGLLALRPSMETYKDFQDILREGDFRNNTGWGGVKVGPFYGSMTIQGIMPYYYDYLHSGNKSVELNHCMYNNMADNPRDKTHHKGFPDGKCRTGKLDCEDCRKTPIEEIYNFHFTCCQKPWWCLQMVSETIYTRI